LKDEKERGAITIIIMYVEEYTVINPRKRKDGREQKERAITIQEEKKKYII
jgi:hypothetical protein